MSNLAKALISLAAAALLLWAGLSLVGLIVVFAVEHKYFGLPISAALLFEEFLAWVPLCLALGALVGYICHPKAVVFGFATASFALFGLVLNGISYWSDTGFTANQVVKAALLVLASPGLFVLIFFPLGSYAGSRLRRA